VRRDSQVLDFFSLHRAIFGMCPSPDCGAIFRLSDCQLSVRKRPLRDWRDSLDQADARLAKLEEDLEGKAAAIRERAREKGRRQALLAVRRIDPIFSPRRLNPDDAKVIFHPVDFVVFNGMKTGERIKSIILLDREGVSSEQRKLQKTIERTVEKGRYEWQTLRVGDDGTIAVDE
jgi:predicted Holliday junction resolvase-like endonuclease